MNKHTCTYSELGHLGEDECVACQIPRTLKAVGEWLMAHREGLGCLVLNHEIDTFLRGEMPE